MSQLQTYAPLLPEIIIAVAAMVFLMYGVSRPETGDEGRSVGWGAIAVLAAAGFLILSQPAGSETMFDGAFVIDGFGRFMKVLVLSGSAVALLLAFDDFTEHKHLKFEYPVLVLLATTGMMMMVSAGDLIALYLAIELQSLALYVVAAFRRDSLRSSEAGLKYFVLGALSSGMLLYGASLIYGFTGSTSFPVIAKVATAATATQNIGLIFGLVFIMVGLAFKVSAVPFHMWTPDVYEGAPTPVTAFFAAAPKMAAMALFVRVVFGAFPDIAVQWQLIVSILAVASMLLGAFAAIGQRNIKRLMAYSSIANIGYALVGLAAASEEGTKGVLLYMAIYLVMTLGAFACILAMRRADGAVEEIDELAGLAQHNLPMAFILAMLLFSLAGVPPLAGFFAKFFVFLAAINAKFYTLAVIGVLASVVGAYYYVRIVKVMFIDEPREKFLPVRTKEGLVMGLACAFVLFFIIPYVANPLFDAAEVAARTFRY
jgi:NADH-quinone oxidoreductase subunit N